MGGTITVSMRSSAARVSACSGPLPPKATSVWSRASRPRSVETARIARVIRGVGEHVDPVGGVLERRHAERLRDLLSVERGERLSRSMVSEPSPNVPVGQVAEHEVRVGDRRLAAAVAVAGGAGHGARAARADLQAAAGSSQAMLPPPAPTSTRSIAGTRTT